MIDVLDQLLARSSTLSHKRQPLGNLSTYFPPLPFHLRGLDLSLQELSSKITRNGVFKSGRTGVRLILGSFKGRRRLLRSRKAGKRKGYGAKKEEEEEEIL